MRKTTTGWMHTLIGSLAIGAALALAGAALAAAPAPKPPLAYPGYVEQITTTTAQLKARINPEGQATTFFFEYGPTASYGSQTPSASAGNGTQEVKLTQPASGLQAGTTYHFRVVASSSAGTTNSVDATFATKRIPLSLTDTATPAQVVLGSPLSISGTLTGTGNAGVQIVVQANPFPYNQGFHNITSAELTDPGGHFQFPLAGLLESTRLRAVALTTPQTVGPVLIVSVAARVTLHVRPTGARGRVRLYGTVTPGEHGARIAFERYEHGRYVVVAGTRIRDRRKGLSRFSRVLSVRPGRYRALVAVTNGPLASGRSLPIVLR